MKRRQASPQAAKRAAEIVEQLRIRDPAQLDLELIAAHFEVFIRYRPLSRQQGHIVRRGKRAIIVVNASHLGQPRARWVIAHELGHHQLHEGTDQYKACTQADLTTYRTSGHEPEANQFAAERLMPTKLFEPDCDRNRPNLRDVKELATKYNTSLTATAIRLAQFSPEPCAAVISKAGKVVHISRSATWRYYVPTGWELSQNTYAGDLHVGKGVPDAPLNVDATAWTSSEWAEEHDIREHSMVLGNTGLVLSMLWAPDL